MDCQGANCLPPIAPLSPAKIDDFHLKSAIPVKICHSMISGSNKRFSNVISPFPLKHLNTVPSKSGTRNEMNLFQHFYSVKHPDKHPQTPVNTYQCEGNSCSQLFHPIKERNRSNS